MNTINTERNQIIHKLVGEVKVAPELVSETVIMIEAILDGGTDEQEIVEQGREQIYLLPRFGKLSNKMYYRDYVGVHETRLNSMVIFCQHFLHFFSSKFDFIYAGNLAMEHDETEGISPLGDIPTHIKTNLSESSIKLLEEIEYACMRSLLQHINLGSCNKEKQHKIYLDALHKISLEGKVVSYLDKLDGFMTSFHEITAGNESFREPFLNYINIFKEIVNGEKYPELNFLFHADRGYFLKRLSELFDEYDDGMFEWLEISHEFFCPQKIVEQEGRLEELLAHGKPHTKEDIMNDDFGLPAYGAWKRSVININNSVNVGGEFLNPMEILIKRR